MPAKYELEDAIESRHGGGRASGIHVKTTTGIGIVL